MTKGEDPSDSGYTSSSSPEPVEASEKSSLSRSRKGTFSNLSNLSVAMIGGAGKEPSRQSPSRVLYSKNDILGHSGSGDEHVSGKLMACCFQHVLDGDVEKTADLLGDARCRALLDLDARDADGNTLLTYASAFAYNNIVKLLLSHGAQPDSTDALGWTPLIWACTNSHSLTSRILLAHKASSQVRSASGRSLRDLIGKSPDPASRGILRLLNSPGDDDYDDLESLADSEWSIGDDSAFEASFTTSDCGDIDEDDGQWGTFSYDTCLPSEMLVFDVDNMDEVLNAAVIKTWLLWLEARAKNKKAKPSQAANVLYLLARFAGYHCSDDTLQEFLFAVVERVCGVVRTNKDDQLLVAYWTTNLMILLHHLKRDGKLLLITSTGQAMISELIGELHIILVSDTRSQIAGILEAAIIEFDGEQEELSPRRGRREPRSIKYENSLFSRLSRRKHYTSSLQLPSALGAKMASSATVHLLDRSWQLRAKPPSTFVKPKPIITSLPPLPRTIAQILTNTLRTLKSAYTHPHIINLTMHNILHAFSTTLFNTMLTSAAPNHPCSKSTAIRIQLNLTAIRDWIRDTGRYVPSSRIRLQDRLQPVIDLCRFVGILTTLGSLPDLLETKPAGLSYRHLGRILDLYRYEVDEPTVDREIIEYVGMMCESLAGTSEAQADDERQEENDEDGIGDPRRNPCLDLLDTAYMLPFQVPGPEDEGWGAGPIVVDPVVCDLLGSSRPPSGLGG
ncbi:hypothetical protein HKX48_005214 [Thoreauomyces humboldtii]|nr:hypothetical protein HKX48_005214 [Thoreauomyces humboldtii]